MDKEKQKAREDYRKGLDKINSNIKKFRCPSQYRQAPEAQLGIKRSSQTCSLPEKVAFQQPQCSLLMNKHSQHSQMQILQMHRAQEEAQLEKLAAASGRKENKPHQNSQLPTQNAKANTQLEQLAAINGRQQSNQEDYEEYDSQIDGERNDAAGDKEGQERKRVRGRSRCLKLFGISGENRITIILNDKDQPVGPEGSVSMLSSYLGFLARNAHLVPLTYTDWRHIPIETKEDLWGKISDKFIIEERGKSWALTTISNSWRSWKSRMKREHFDKYKTIASRLKNRPTNIPMEQWKVVVQFWNSEEGRARSERNLNNSRKASTKFSNGRKSEAITREELKRKDGVEPSQAKMFLETRRKKNGELNVVEEAINDVECLEVAMAADDKNSQNAILDKLVKPRAGRVPLYGKGVTPTNLKRMRCTNDIEAIHAEASRIAKEKITSVESKAMKVVQQLVSQVQAIIPDFQAPPDLLCDLMTSESCDTNCGVDNSTKLPTEAHAPSTLGSDAENEDYEFLA